ncbi:hypothetical protein QYE76_041937 [Lolium multiflorum]|uniref:Uncharacterized protein n=1 Tax=Lolium multiflorum TaxID=4521 RepID=A0AAD8TFZ6_LOLMU|nr:hypothetical protein QYE76_041937 [Lolium multiflorum]
MPFPAARQGRGPSGARRRRCPSRRRAMDRGLQRAMEVGVLLASPHEDESLQRAVEIGVLPTARGSEVAKRSVDENERRWRIRNEWLPVE